MSFGDPWKLVELHRPGGMAEREALGAASVPFILAPVPKTLEAGRSES